MVKNPKRGKSESTTLRSLAELGTALRSPAGNIPGHATPTPNRPKVEAVGVPKKPEPAVVATPVRTLTLKRGPLDKGVVRQSFSHGRNKSVVVEKVRRRTADDSAAAQLVDRARKGGVETLDFSNFAVLERLPSLVGLANLVEITLSGTNIKDLEPLSAVTGLQRVNIDRTPVTTLWPLRNLSSLVSVDASNTKLSDLEGLAQLAKLRTVLVSGTKVSDLAPLSSLRFLETLDISKTNVSNLNPLQSLERLRTINAQDTGISDLASIHNNAGLLHLNIQSTRVSSLMPLEKLKSLQRLIINNTAVSDLSPVANLKSLAAAAKISPESDGIQFHGCPLSDPYLLKLAGTPNPSRTAEAIEYLQQQAEKNERTNEDRPAPPVEAIPRQVKTAISFTSANLGPLDISSGRRYGDS